MPAEAGIEFGQYVLLRRIARGGMAEVFLAQQRGLEGFDRRVAVKRILPDLVDSSDFVKMFLSEAKLAAQLGHPNIVHIYEFGKVDEDYFIAMEYVEGVHAGQLFKHGGGGDCLTPTLVARIGADAATALQHAHDLRGLGLVHRDVSPANIMVSFDGIVKLCDFGIAKAAALGDQLTNPGQVKGKYAYMSPEQTTAQALDGRSDVFSLSIVLWELLAGTYIVSHGDAVAAMRALRDGRIEPLSKLAPHVPVALAEAVMWGLQTRREDRATATELAQALEAFIKSSPELATAMQLAGWIRKRFARDAATPPAVPQHVVHAATPARDDESLTRVNLILPVGRTSAPSKGPDAVPLGAIAAQVFHTPERRHEEPEDAVAAPPSPRVTGPRPAVDPDEEPTVHVGEPPIAELERREMIARLNESGAPVPSPPMPSGPATAPPIPSGPATASPMPSGPATASAPRHRRVARRPRWMRLGVPIAAMVGLAVLSFVITLAVARRHVTAPAPAPMSVTPASDASSR